MRGSRVVEMEMRNFHNFFPYFMYYKWRGLKQRVKFYVAESDEILCSWIVIIIISSLKIHFKREMTRPSPEFKLLSAAGSRVVLSSLSRTLFPEVKWKQEWVENQNSTKQCLLLLSFTWFCGWVSSVWLCGCGVTESAWILIEIKAFQHKQTPISGNSRSVWN